VEPAYGVLVRFPAGEPALLDLALEDHPVATLLLDGELRVLHANAAARALLDPASTSGAGEILRCLEAATAEGGCGSGGRCGHCLVRRVARSALAGVAARERAFLSRSGGGASGIHLLAAAAPAARAGRPAALVAVTDLAEVLALPAVLTVCAGCAKIRASAGGWIPLSAYLDERLGVEVSHGLCDGCARRLYPEPDG
jgi:hypothetical protein